MNETSPEFEVSQDYTARSVQEAPRSIVAQLVMRSGLARTESAANTVAIGFAIICFAIAGYLAFGESSSAPTAGLQAQPIGAMGSGGIPQP